MKNLLNLSKQILYSTFFTFIVVLPACKQDDDSSSGPTIPSSATILTTAPADATTGVPINRKITATFSQAMNPTTISTITFKLTGPDTSPVSGTVTYEAGVATAVFSPASPLALSTVYTATITTGAKDKEGLALASDFVWTFTSGSTSDTTPAQVSATIPANNSIGVAINGNITATFDEAMDPATLNTTAFTVLGPDLVAVLGVVTFSGTTASFNPTIDLAIDSLYTVALSSEVKDLAGNGLANAHVWSFTTGSTASLGPAPVILGTAGDYVILAKSAISTTGVTSVVGNIGLSPSAQSFITGFSEALDATNVFATSSLVTGKLFAADMAVPTPSNLTTAISNMETAYTDAAGRTLPDFTELGAGDVSGKTLAPGLYKWGTGVLMTSDVTLSGSANDVWIFQIAQDLTVSNGVQITLAGSALPKNIFWQVAGQVTLGTTSSFSGIILSKTKIVLQTGAVLKGRTLAQTAVTLDANAVTQPAL